MGDGDPQRLVVEKMLQVTRDRGAKT